MRELREERNWSQGDLADRLRDLNLPYMTQATVSRIENKTRPVRLMEAQALSRLFDRPISTMTNPDSREFLIVLAEASHRHGRQSYVQVKKAAQEFWAAQTSVKDSLEHLQDQFGNGSDLEPELKSKYDNLIPNMTQLSRIDIVEDVATIMRRSRGSDSGKHPEAP